MLEVMSSTWRNHSFGAGEEERSDNANHVPLRRSLSEGTRCLARRDEERGFGFMDGRNESGRRASFTGKIDHSVAQIFFQLFSGFSLSQQAAAGDLRVDAWNRVAAKDSLLEKPEDFSAPPL